MAFVTYTGPVSPMTREDLKEVVAVHLRSFPEFFLTYLGPRFLQCLYEEILSDRSGIALVCRQGQRIVGFVAGTGEPRGFYGRLLARRWHRFALASLLPVLKNPAIIPRLLNARRKAKEEADHPECGLLMSIAVDPHAQTTGIGAALVQQFLREARNRGLRSIYLTTDRFENERANRFYSKTGFALSRVITTAQARVMNEYWIELG